MRTSTEGPGPLRFLRKRHVEIIIVGRSRPLFRSPTESPPPLYPLLLRASVTEKY